MTGSFRRLGLSGHPLPGWQKRANRPCERPVCRLGGHHGVHDGIPYTSDTPDTLVASATPFFQIGRRRGTTADISTSVTTLADIVISPKGCDANPTTPLDLPTSRSVLLGTLMTQSHRPRSAGQDRTITITSPATSIDWDSLVIDGP